MKKQLVKISSQLFPNFMAEKAYNALTNPQVKKLRSHELTILDQAQKEKFKFGEFDIQTYQWGNPQDQKILLIHGWEGQAGNFADIIPKLLEQNYFVHSFDGPSHGFSSKGQTSLFEFSDLVGELIKKYQCKYLISHSFGGVATTLALFNNRDIEIDKYILFTTPDKFSQRIDDVVKMVGVTEKVKNILINRLETEMNINVNEVGVSRFVQEINVNHPLIIHDKNDKVIPITRSQNVMNNWKNCQLEVVEGTGHFRILRTEKVIEKALRFLKEDKINNRFA